MLIRLMLTLAILVTVTACSSKDEEFVGTSSGYDATSGAGYDSTQYGNAGTGVDGSVIPGSQQDLATNVGDRVFFAYDSYDLTPEARATLEKQAQWLNQYASLAITIEGHADERGTREYNIALGERRANSTRSYLTALGVNASRINVISYGKERPAVADASPSGWAQNRRSVTVVQ